MTRPLATLVEPSRSAVLVIDVQPVFVDEPDPPMTDALRTLAHFLDAARDARVLRVFVRLVRAEAPDERWTTLWEEQCGADFLDLVAPDSPDAAFLPGYEPRDGDLEVRKDQYSAFQGTNLAEQLRTAAVETVLVTGFSTDVCVSSTARDAFQNNFDTITVSDCCAAAEPEAHEAALATLARRFGRVCPASDVISAWRTATSTL